MQRHHLSCTSACIKKSHAAERKLCFKFAAASAFALYAFGVCATVAIPVRAFRLLSLQFRNIDKQELLKAGAVRHVHADGSPDNPVTDPKELVYPGDVLIVPPSGKELHPEEFFQPSGTRIWALHKPYGLDAMGPEMMNWFEQIAAEGDLFCRNGIARVMGIGRLDKGTTGLLLATNDGDLSRLIREPRLCSKQYHVLVRGDITARAVHTLRAGFALANGSINFSPLDVRLVRHSLRVTISQGETHIIKRALEEVGYPVKYMHRIRVGNVVLSKLRLARGAHVELTRPAVGAMWRLVGVGKWRLEKELGFLKREHVALWREIVKYYRDLESRGS